MCNNDEQTCIYYLNMYSNVHRDRENIVYQVANMYYVQDLTMSEIADKLNCSRSSVSRMLKTARQEGIVTISLKSLPPHKSSIVNLIHEKFNVDVTIIQTSQVETPTQVTQKVCATAANRIADIMKDNISLGIAWGNTISQVVKYIQPKKIQGGKIVQLNGAASASSSGITYATSIVATMAKAYNSRAIYFPVPAFFDYAKTKEGMWNERSIKFVLEHQANLDVAVFSVGSLESLIKRNRYQDPVASYVYTADFLSSADRREIVQEAVVGDVCTVFIRQDGSYTDITLNQRASGPTPHALRKIPKRLCVVSGVSKAKALLAALNAGVITELVVDEETIRATLALMDKNHV